MDIRRVHADEFDAVWMLHNEALDAIEAHGGNGPWDDDVRDPLGRYVDAGGEFLVAIVGAKVVGMVGVLPVSPCTFEMKRLRVSPTLQRKGIGTALVQEAERIAAKLGASSLVLDTTTLQVAAQSFYARRGYQEVRRSWLGRFEVVHYEKRL